MLIAVLVNPDAGLGGKLGFKGSDGRAKEAREAGAKDRAGPRMIECLERLQILLEQRSLEIDFITIEGRMGSEWFGSINHQIIHETGVETIAQDTINAIRVMTHADLILYAGGDGTTRDIISALDGKKVPIVGVPGGVKMHSGCFAATPRAAAEVVCAFVTGELMLASTEVMDLDEEVYAQGIWRVRMYGEVMTPSSPRWMQGAKEAVESASEEETIQALAEHIQDLRTENPELMIIWGSGGTLRTMAELNNFEPTLLGIDITIGDVIYKDLNEQQILKHLNEEHQCLLLLSPMGGQGFLIGRGNLQLSPEVLRKIGLDNILGVATSAKLLSLNSLRIDTGDRALDEEFIERKYLKLLQGYRTTRIMRVAED